jgi:hypothetical protein
LELLQYHQMNMRGERAYRGLIQYLTRA